MHLPLVTPTRDPLIVGLIIYVPLVTNDMHVVNLTFSLYVHKGGPN